MKVEPYRSIISEMLDLWKLPGELWADSSDPNHNKLKHIVWGEFNALLFCVTVLIIIHQIKSGVEFSTVASCQNPKSFQIWSLKNRDAQPVFLVRRLRLSALPRVTQLGGEASVLPPTHLTAWLWPASWSLFWSLLPDSILFHNLQPHYTAFVF